MTEIQQQREALKSLSPGSLRRKEAKKQGKRCLFEQKNGLTLIAAFVVLMALAMAPMFMIQMVETAVDPLGAGMSDMLTDSTVFDALAYGLWAVLVAPLLAGYLYIAVGLAGGQKRSVKDLFYAYTSIGAYFRAWLSLLIPLAGVGAILGVVRVMTDTGYALALIVKKANMEVFYQQAVLTAFDIISAVLAVAGILLLGYLLSVSIWMLKGDKCSILTAIRIGFTTVRGHLMEILCFHLSFLGWMALSVLSVGILFAVFVLPYYLLSLTYLFSALWEDKRREILSA